MFDPPSDQVFIARSSRSSGSAAEEGSPLGSEETSGSKLEGSEEGSSDVMEVGSTVGSEKGSELGSALGSTEEEGSAELLGATGVDELEEIGALAHPHNRSAHVNKMIRFMVVGK